MRENESKLAVVVDEYGGTVGIVTVSDIMERIMGRMDDEYIRSSKNQIISFNDDTARVHGYMSIDKLEDLLDFAADEDDEFNTVAGLLFTLFERVPDEGDRIAINRNGYRFEFTVIRMNRNAIEEIDIQRTQPALV